MALRAAGRPARTARQVALAALDQLGLLAHASSWCTSYQAASSSARRLPGLTLEPRLLIADEPTAELDPAARILALARMSEVPAAGGVLVVATHDPEVAERCDEVLDLSSQPTLGNVAARSPASRRS